MRFSILDLLIFGFTQLLYFSYSDVAHYHTPGARNSCPALHASSYYMHQIGIASGETRNSKIIA